MIDAHWKQIILTLLSTSTSHVNDVLRQTWGEFQILPVTFCHVPTSSMIQGWINEVFFEIHSHVDASGNIKLEFFQNGKSMVDLKFVRLSKHRYIK